MSFKTLFTIFCGFSSTDLKIGSRVRTPHGTGVVTGGSLQVDLDEGQARRPCGFYRVNVTSNLSQIEALRE